MELAIGCSAGWWGTRRLGGRVMLLSWGLLAFGCGEGPVEEAVEELAAILSTDSLDFGSVEVHLSTVRSFGAVSRKSWMYYHEECFMDGVYVAMKRSLGGACS